MYTGWFFKAEFAKHIFLPGENEHRIISHKQRVRVETIFRNSGEKLNPISL